MKYNEYVGSLGAFYAGGKPDAELHVRYGERNGCYYDWSIELVLRLGDVTDFRATHERCRRVVLEAMRVEDSAIVHVVRSDNDVEDSKPHMEVLAELSAGDGPYVDQWFDHSMRLLSEQWAQRAGQPSPHAIATFGFASENRKPKFRHGEYDWVRNTLVCLSSDVADDAIAERLATYFSERATVASFDEASRRMRFITVDPGKGIETNPQRTCVEDGTMRASGDVTIGMLVDTIYADDDWMDRVLDERH